MPCVWNKIVDTERGTGRGIDYNEWEHKRRGSSWKQKIRLEIDGLILKVKNVDELLAELEMLDYTVESLASRILWKDVGSGVSLLGQPSELSKRYTTTIYDVEQLALAGRKVQRRRDTSAPYSPQNDLDVYKLSAQLTIINRDNLRSIGEVEGKIRQLEYEIEKARQELNAAQQDTLTGLAEQAEEYFSLLDKPKRTPAEEPRLKMYKPILERNNITSRSDYEYLKSVIVDTQKKAAPLKENFERCRQLYELYSEISKTYYEISKGDCIMRMVEEEQKAFQSAYIKTKRCTQSPTYKLQPVT